MKDILSSSLPIPTPSHPVPSPYCKPVIPIFMGVLEWAIMHPDKLCKYRVSNQFDSHSENRLEILC